MGSCVEETGEALIKGFAVFQWGPSGRDSLTDLALRKPGTGCWCPLHLRPADPAGQACLEPLLLWLAQRLLPCFVSTHCRSLTLGRLLMLVPPPRCFCFSGELQTRLQGTVCILRLQQGLRDMSLPAHRLFGEDAFSGTLRSSLKRALSRQGWKALPDLSVKD